MTLNESSVPALGVEERSDEAPRAGHARPTPDPEVVAKPKRRQFTAQYRLRILEEAERCTQPGEVGPVALNARHQTPVVVVHNRQRDRAEERKRVHVPVNPQPGPSPLGTRERTTHRFAAGQRRRNAPSARPRR